jgi:hypothetical protein
MPARQRRNGKSMVKHVKGKGKMNSVTTMGVAPKLERITDVKAQTIFERKHTYNSNAFTAATSDQFASMYFNLNSIPASDLAAVTALFDMYRVKEVTVCWIPQFNVSAMFGAGDIPVIFSALDFDDITVPPNTATVQSYATAKRSLANKYVARRFVPATLGIGSSGGSTSSGLFTYPKTSQWMDIAFTGINFMGSKWSIGSSSAAGTYALGYFSVSALVEYRQSR